MGYSGDTFTGVVTRVSDATREITLTYHGQKGDETFVGVLQEHYTVPTQGGKGRELRVLEIPIGARLIVYYSAKQKEVGGRKVKYYEIFRVGTPTGRN